MRDLVGQKFGRLTVVGLFGKYRREYRWRCECSCGTKDLIVLAGNLRSGHSRSCGCLQRDFPNPGRYRAIPAEESFWRFVSKDGPVMRPELGRCWIWFGSTFPGGHAQFRNSTAHAFSYRLHKGPVPTGLEIDHLCRIRCCVNPEHLEAVTRHENLSRGKSWKHRAMFQRQAHCKRGHPLTAENRRVDGCRICYNRRNREYLARKREINNAAWG